MYQGFDLDCGEHRVRAVVSGAERECFSHSAGCRVTDFVTFVAPTALKAVARLDGSVQVLWRLVGGGGWVPPQTLLRLEDDSGKIILPTRKLGDDEAELEMQELRETTDYKLVFTPGGTGVPKSVVENSAVIVLCECN